MVDKRNISVKYFAIRLNLTGGDNWKSVEISPAFGRTSAARVGRSNASMRSRHLGSCPSVASRSCALTTKLHGAVLDSRRLVTKESDSGMRRTY